MLLESGPRSSRSTRPCALTGRRARRRLSGALRPGRRARRTLYRSSLGERGAPGRRALTDIVNFPSELCRRRSGMFTEVARLVSPGWPLWPLWSTIYIYIYIERYVLLLLLYIIIVIIIIIIIIIYVLLLSGPSGRRARRSMSRRGPSVNNLFY